MSPDTAPIINAGTTNLKDYLSPTGWERIRYRSAVNELNALIAPHALPIVGVGAEWETIVVRKETRQGIGPSLVTLKAKNEGGTVVLRLDHRREDYYSGTRPMYGKPGERSFWNLDHRTTVLKIKDGAILSIETGREGRSDIYSDQKDPQYLASSTPQWESFEPKVLPVGGLIQQTEVLRNTSKSLRAAADKYATGLVEVS